MANEQSIKKLIKLGTRTSKLAITQTEIVVQLLLDMFPDLEVKIVSKTTLGDNMPSKPLYSFGGKALWTSELEALLLAKEEDEKESGLEKIDMIVHSLKDLPTTLPEDFELGAILNRQDARDALVVRPDLPYKSIKELPDGSVVGTSSIRRTAQLARRYPHLKFKVVRGNVYVDT